MIYFSGKYGWYCIGAVFLSASFCLADDTLPSVAVDGQPLAAGARRVAAALELLGSNAGPKPMQCNRNGFEVVE